MEMAKVLIRNDGTPTYVAKDIAFHMWKFGLLEDKFTYISFIDKQPDGTTLFSTSKTGKHMDYGNVKKAINIIGSAQDYPQALVRLVFTLMGMNEIAAMLQHLSYGELELDSGALSGRSGNWIGSSADDLLGEARRKALSSINDTKTPLPENQRAEVSNAVAVGAIKFDLLRLSPEKKTVFSWERALSFTGNSGPYCQYMYARAVRLLEDSGMGEVAPFDENEITTDTEFALVKNISRLSELTEKAALELRPNIISEYCIELSTSFSEFYQNMPILKTEHLKLKQARLSLVLAFANTIKYSLALLGIPVVNRM